MKIKKLWTGTASFCVGASLLATVLTSCSAGKIDEDLIVNLDDDGNLIGNTSKFEVTYQDAIKLALTRADSWANFKEALAEEIVYSWYKDRAASDEHKDRNEEFQIDLKGFEKDVKKDYDDTVQTCKDKYGSNYQFYLQNQYLSPNGGTEETYKHIQEVQKVKTKFISNVWESNYFGYCENWDTKKDKVYPRALDETATGDISTEKLNDPSSWKDLGFYAYADPSYYAGGQKQPETKADVDTNLMSSYPQGDYATIQNYVFDRWFDTEKPFFSAASLFKYTKPANGGLDKIYDTGGTGITLPDEPNEAFPFFGGTKPDQRGTGTKAYFNWYHDLIDGKYLTYYGEGAARKPSNGTISIPVKGHTDDSQTLLLSYASKMIGGSENALYIPYATAAAQLYLKMLDIEVPNSKMNEISAQRIARSFIGEDGRELREIDCGDENRALILKNFFFTESDGGYSDATKTHWTPKKGSGIDSLNSFIDLENIYGSTASKIDGNYHSRLFVAPFYDNEYDFYYGRPLSGVPGIKFITNTVMVDDLKSPIADDIQPWILELNESGMHAQTIDGYYFIQNPTEFGITGTSTKELAKQVLKYRLMQKKCDIGASGSISADIFGSSGALAKYFENNFANIILEIAMLKGDDNVFRPIDTYKADFVESSTYIQELITKQGFSDSIIAYLKQTTEYDEKKKVVDAITAANKAIYSYHVDQVRNSKYEYSYFQIFNNGLTGPMCLSTLSRADVLGIDPEWALHDYAAATGAVYFEWVDGEAIIPNLVNYTFDALGKILSGTALTNFVNWAWENASAINDKLPFSPQISKAKAAKSNRFWYYSPNDINIVDRTIYSAMGTSNGLINLIKSKTMSNYVADVNSKIVDYEDKIKTNEMVNSTIATYYKNKVLSGDITYANVADKASESSYYDAIKAFYNALSKNQASIEGDYSTFATNQGIFEATLCYLMLDSTNANIPFGNFYKILNSKVSENEAAIIGYLNKVNTSLETTDESKKPTLYFDSGLGSRYDWSPDVDNIYDQVHYSIGNMTHIDIENARVACEEYWNVVSRKINGISKIFAGFTGLQTKSSNTFTASLKDAVFASETDHTAGVAGHTVGSIKLSEATSTDQPVYKSNTGAWFNFGGKFEKGKDIEFEPIIYRDDKGVEHKITWQDFACKEVDGELIDTRICRRLVKKISHYSTMDDLRDLAKDLGDSYYGSSIYRDIGEGVTKYTDIGKMKYDMANALPRFNGDELIDDNDYLKCFDRLTNVEVHETGVSNPSYCFEDDSSGGYNLMLTQISKADIAENNLHPGWVGKKWVQDWTDAEGKAHHAAITPEEFFFMLCQTACETSVQSLAITEAIKDVFKDNKKLEVYDASLYNIFDSVWVKDWVKKPMGQ